MPSDAAPNGASGARGFAGLRDLAVPVSPEPPPASPPPPPVTEAQPPEHKEAEAEPAAPVQNQDVYQGPPARKGISGILTPRGKLVAGCLVVGAIIWAAANQGDDNQSRRAAAPADSYASTAPAALTEVRPPVGTDVVLSSDQLFYCFSESVRLDGAKGAVDQTDNNEIDRFNAMVDDYNNRCGSFRYEKGTLDAVRAQVDAERSELLSEGAARFRR